MPPIMRNIQPTAPAVPEFKHAGQASRYAALMLLRAVLRQKRPLDDALEASPECAKLEARDRGFARVLVATTLRRLGQIDAALAELMREKVKAKDEAAADLLRLGACQLLFLGTPPHAALDATIGLAEALGVGHLKPLLNGVLRQLDRDRGKILVGQDAVALNLPHWLARSWSLTYGEPAMRAIATALMEEPPLDLTPRGDAEALAARVEGTVLPTGSVRRPLGGLVSELAGFAEGEWWVQDAAAAIPARLLCNVAGLRVLDLCAAPGGKTAQLAAAGAIVTALDRSAPRMRRLSANLERLGLTATSIVADAATWTTQESFDAVLLDAPCSATGTIRRHPDIAHLKHPTDVNKLISLQDKLLNAAAVLVKPGGTIVYCTCSLEPQEGPERIQAALARHPNLSRKPIDAAELGGSTALVTPAGDFRSLPSHWPEIGGIDGFYAARLVRA
jgi:16S rRNA (cytosine967-C5)-methyltransferase